jgi:prepilin-type N-terminal cleavage/methylation domain-containing protein
MKKGFTLIELIVVIAIIGILSTLTIVQAQNYRRKTKNAARIEYVRQIITGLEMFYSLNRAYPYGGSCLGYLDTEKCFTAGHPYSSHGLDGSQALNDLLKPFVPTIYLVSKDPIIAQVVLIQITATR